MACPPAAMRISVEVVTLAAEVVAAADMCTDCGAESGVDVVGAAMVLLKRLAARILVLVKIESRERRMS